MRLYNQTSCTTVGFSRGPKDSKWTNDKGFVQKGMVATEHDSGAVYRTNPDTPLAGRKSISATGEGNADYNQTLPKRVSLESLDATKADRRQKQQTVKKGTYMKTACSSDNSNSPKNQGTIHEDRKLSQPSQQNPVFQQTRNNISDEVVRATNVPRNISLSRQAPKNTAERLATKPENQHSVFDSVQHPCLSPSLSLITEPSYDGSSDVVPSLAAKRNVASEKPHWLEFPKTRGKNPFLNGNTPDGAENKVLPNQEPDSTEAPVSKQAIKRQAVKSRSGNLKTDAKGDFDQSFSSPKVVCWDIGSKREGKDKRKSQRNPNAGILGLPPPPKDVEPIFAPTKQKKALDVSKYTLMLKSGFAFSCVKRTMQRDGVDQAIIDLADSISSNSK